MQNTVQESTKNVWGEYSRYSNDVLVPGTTVVLPPQVNRAVIYKTWVRTPNFPTLQEMGQLPMQPYSYIRTEFSPLTGNVTNLEVRYGMLNGQLKRYSELDRTVGAMVGPTAMPSFSNQLQFYPFKSPSSVEKAACLALAKNKVILEIKNQKVNIAQFLAEREQVINLIGDTIKKIAGSYRALKRGDIISAGKALGARPSRSLRRQHRSRLKTQSPKDAAADTWLQLQYGVLPLISDIYGTIEMLKQRVSDYEIFKAKASHTIKFEDEVPVYWLGGSTPPFMLSRTVKFTCKYTFNYSIQQKASSQMSQMGLTNPALLLWEVLPYSFVVDWFLPVGNYLQTLDAFVGVSFSSGCLVTVLQQENSIEAGNSFSFNEYGSGLTYRTVTHSFRDARFFKRNKEIFRTVETAFPTPQLPALKNPVSVTHVANALALLNNVFKRR